MGGCRGCRNLHEDRMFPHLHTPALEGCWKLGEAEMKAKLLWGVLSAPPYQPPALPGSSELGGCGRVLSWSLTLEAPTPGKGRRRRQGGHQSALDWRSHQTCVKDSWSGRRAWEVAPGGRGKSHHLLRTCQAHQPQRWVYFTHRTHGGAEACGDRTACPVTHS